MTITAVGSFTFGHVINSDGPVSLAVSPSVGNCLVVCISINGASAFQYPCVVSGGGVTTWVPLRAFQYFANRSELWAGVVTSGGSSSVSVTTTNIPSLMYTGVQEFNSSIPVAWTKLPLTATYGAGTAAGNYPAITADGPDQLYIAAGTVGAGGLNGSDAGFVYYNGYGPSSPTGQAAFVYYLDASSPTTYSPSFTCASGNFAAAAALLIGHGQIVMSPGWP